MKQEKFNLLKLREYNSTLKPLEQEVGDFLRTKFRSRSLQDKYSNDLRHQYASAVFTQKYGPNVAKTLGNYNEWKGGSGDLDTEIDQINNEIGRNYGIKYPNMSKNELLNKLFEDHEKNVEIRKNKMKKSTPTGFAAPANDSAKPLLQDSNNKPKVLKTPSQNVADEIDNDKWDDNEIAFLEGFNNDQPDKHLITEAKERRKQRIKEKGNKGVGPNGEDGYWYTTKKSKHVFVEEDKAS